MPLGQLLSPLDLLPLRVLSISLTEEIPLTSLGKVVSLLPSTGIKVTMEVPSSNTEVTTVHSTTKTPPLSPLETAESTDSMSSALPTVEIVDLLLSKSDSLPSLKLHLSTSKIFSAPSRSPGELPLTMVVLPLVTTELKYAPLPDKETVLTSVASVLEMSTSRPALSLCLS